MKKYELTNETVEFRGRTLHRLRALKSFNDVKKGDLGGYVEKEGNLIQCGDAQVYGDAWVYGDAQVYGDADYLTLKGLGSEYRTSTIFKNQSGGISVKCGCFFGALAEFRKKVKETHGDSKFAKEYLALANLAELHFTEAEKS